MPIFAGIYSIRYHIGDKEPYSGSVEFKNQQRDVIVAKVVDNALDIKWNIVSWDPSSRGFFDSKDWYEILSDQDKRLHYDNISTKTGETKVPLSKVFFFFFFYLIVFSFLVLPLLLNYIAVGLMYL